eukprot:5721886-Lingulodinium_polyedra.AAC.1
MEPTGRKIPWVFQSGAPEAFELLSLKMAGPVCLRRKAAKAKAKGKVKTTPKETKTLAEEEGTD